MSNSLQFKDCPYCGKRVRTTAPQCHHCHQPLVVAARDKMRTASPPGDSEDESHSATGGYDVENDDFDYEEYLAEEFPDQARVRRSNVKSWVWITAWVLIIATLLPFFYYFLIRQ